MGENKIQPWQLAQRQSLSLDGKIAMSELRIRNWHDYYEGDVYVAFSGGKDLTVLLDLVRSIYPKVPAVFCDTGLEYPEIREFVKTIDNVTWLRPKISFKEVLEKYGYPVVSKRVAQYVGEVQRTKSNHLKKLRLTGIRKDGTLSKMAKISNKWQYLIDADFKVSDKCCKIMKKDITGDYQKKTGRHPFVGTSADNSQHRQLMYLQHGCNAFHLSSPRSTPLSFWMEKDVWKYINRNDLQYSKIYDMGYDRTGCMFCMFGAHMEKGENRFQKMAKTHPKQYDYCMDKLGLRNVLKQIGVASEPEEMLF
jgi:3'-phosphoadenosine 5'-phosphosulfate sulfotransferase (PAPS reductase)/FAD synthetase